MSEITKMTEQQEFSLAVLRMLGNETASAKKANDFINGSALNFELFRDSYSKELDSGDGSTLPEAISARVDVAIESAKHKLTVFQ